MNGSLFRDEALRHHEGGEDEGDVLRFDRRWARITYGIVAVGALVAFAFASLFTIDEYASGPAVVRVDGRRIITATTPATVEAVDVMAGAWVDVGSVMVRMHDLDEQKELARASNEFDLQVVRMLRDPNDAAVKTPLAALRAQKEQAKNNYESRTIRSQVAGYVSDVRVRPGQHVGAGDVLLAVAPKDAVHVSLVSMLSAEYLPLLKAGLKMRFELDGFRYEYTDLVLTEVSAEAVGSAEVQRLLGGEKSDTIALDPGAKVLVTADLPAASFRSEGRPYGYFDGLTGRADVFVRTEPLLVTLIPALREWVP